MHNQAMGDARLRKILVPLDGTKRSEGILPYVERLALAHKAHLELLHVVDPVAFAGDKPARNDSERVDEARKYLRQLGRDSSELSVATACGLGPVVEVIRERAARDHCDLIAFAPRGHGGLKRWLYGSVAEKVVRDAPCPVLLVRGEAYATYHHILMPVAQDDDPERLVHGLQAFLRPETRLTILHCSDGKQVPEPLRARVSKLVEGRPNSYFLPPQSPAPQGILDWALDSDCDLIAMSTHGRGGLHHLWKGSIMEQVGRHAPCPVLVVRPASA